MINEVDNEKSQTEHIEELSQKLFDKPSKDIKYLLVTNYIHQQLLEEECTRTGLYQWLNVFRGQIKYPRDVVDYNEFDIVQVNLSVQDIFLVNDIREVLGENSKTKLVGNNDYTTEMWGRSFEYSSTLTRELQGADMLFGTEYFMTTALSEISGRKCFIIPHPADIKRLKSLTPIPNQPIISTIWRRYGENATNYYIPSLIIRNHGLTTQLIGYDPKLDTRPYLTSTLYDFVCAGTNYFDFCNQLRQSKIIYDPFTYHSYSRSTIDTAAMGVAVVGSNRTQSINICYPYTVVDPYDVKTARELITKLLKDEEFYKLVIETAKEKVEFYNHLNSKERYLSTLLEAQETNPMPPLKIKKQFVKGIGDDVLTNRKEPLNEMRPTI